MFEVWSATYLCLSDDFARVFMEARWASCCSLCKCCKTTAPFVGQLSAVIRELGYFVDLIFFGPIVPSLRTGRRGLFAAVALRLFCLQ
jgi:hypothetical protein